jgi:hypothetical protein
MQSLIKRKMDIMMNSNLCTPAISCWLKVPRNTLALEYWDITRVRDMPSFPSTINNTYK